MTYLNVSVTASIRTQERHWMRSPRLDIVATAASYGLDAHEAHTADEVTQLVKDGIADRQRPTLISARILPVNA